jgi:hypothetical protein
LSLAIASDVHAQDSETFELRRVRGALMSEGLVRDHAPDGKRIAFIRVVRDDVFVDDELLVPIVLPRFAPTWPNTFHWLTEESVIRNELLVRQGDRYRAAAIEESMRNLRALGTLALVRIVAVRGEQPDEVGLLVYTRDLWSLRTETQLSGAGGAYAFSAQLIERNLFGRNKQLAARFDADPHAWAVGQIYYDRRLAGERLTLSESLDVIFNSERGEPEGSQGALYFGQPFYDLQQRFSWNVSASYAVFVRRITQGTDVVAVRPEEDALVPCDVGEPRCYRQIWDDQRGGVSASGAYRLGVLYKQTFSLKVGFSDHVVEPNEDTLVGAGTRDEVEREILPRTRRQVYPELGYALTLPRYAVLENLSTFGQSENVRIGPELKANVAVPLEAFGSSTDSALFSASAGYVWSEHDALLEGNVSAGTRLEEGRATDQKLGAYARGATPVFLFARLAALFAYSGRRRDSARSAVTLGGDNGLRGYEANAVLGYGASKLRSSAELRTLPLELMSVHVGGVAFYDGGSVYTDARSMRWFHSVGAGVRVLFPQFNRNPFRLDVGFPIDGSGFAVGLSYGSDQALALTAADDEAAATTSFRSQ